MAANGTVTVSDGTSTLASFALPPYSYTNGTIIVTAAGMKSGSQYTLALAGGSQTVEASSQLSGGMGDMPGGGMPGGMNGGMPGRR